jgi:hypothetical protein
MTGFSMGCQQMLWDALLHLVAESAKVFLMSEADKPTKCKCYEQAKSGDFLDCFDIHEGEYKCLLCGRKWYVSRDKNTGQLSIRSLRRRVILVKR